MAYIEKIGFARVGRNEGCLCDRCGQYIRNIVTVYYTDGIRINYGQDCFKKLYDSSKLTDYGKKLLRKALKSIEEHQTEYAKYVSGEMTAENDQSWIVYTWDINKGTYWAEHHDDYEEYRKWMIEEWFPQRFKEDQKQIDRFSKVNFKR